MVAIKSQEADKFIASKPNYICYLIHGIDSGLVKERALQLRANARKARSVENYNFSGNELAANPWLLSDFASSHSLFGDFRTINVEHGTKNYTEALLPILNGRFENTIITIEAPVLKKDHALRKLIDASKTAASIECYPDSQSDIARLCASQLQHHNIKFEEEAIRLLSSHLGQDRLSTRAEIDKIVTHSIDSKILTVSDVSQLIGSEGSLSINPLPEAVFSGDIKKTNSLIYASSESSTNFDSILPLLLRSLSTKPSIHSERRGGYQNTPASLQNWGQARMNAGIRTALKAISSMRTIPNLSAEIGARCLLNLTRLKRERS